MAGQRPPGIPCGPGPGGWRPSPPAPRRSPSSCRPAGREPRTGLTPQPSLATAVTTIVDYSVRAWWTIREGGADLAGTSGPSIRQQLAGGALALVGDDTVDGQPAIHLRYKSRMFTVGGHQYYSDTSDFWVSATSFLPIRETGVNGQWTASLTWSAQPPTAAGMTAVPPAGFTHRSGPPPSLLQTGGGLG